MSVALETEVLSLRSRHPPAACRTQARTHRVFSNLQSTLKARTAEVEMSNGHRGAGRY